MSRATTFLALSLAGLVLAGCITPPGQEGDSAAFDAAVRNSTGGVMTAAEEQTDSVSPCVSNGAGFCAERTIAVTGSLSGFEALETTLSTFNGHVTLVAGEAGKWGFVAKLRARGATPEEAKAAMEEIRFAWAHERDGVHFLDVEAEYEGRDNSHNRGADLDVTLPPEVLLRVAASTVNGPVEVRGVRTDGLSASTTNGEIKVEAQVAHASLETVNGNVDAKLTPTASGRISADTVNGKVRLQVPEGDRNGYDLHGKTVNGKVEINLHDGEVGPCPQGSQYYTPPCNERSFKTRGYDGRAIRSQVTLETVNGAVSVDPA